MLMLRQRMQQAGHPAAAVVVVMRSLDLGLRPQDPDPGRWAAAGRPAAAGGGGLPGTGCPQLSRSPWGWHTRGLAWWGWSLQAGGEVGSFCL